MTWCTVHHIMHGELPLCWNYSKWRRPHWNLYLQRQVFLAYMHVKRTLNDEVKFWPIFRLHFKSRTKKRQLHSFFLFLNLYIYLYFINRMHTQMFSFLFWNFSVNVHLFLYICVCYVFVCVRVDIQSMVFIWYYIVVYSFLARNLNYPSKSHLIKIFLKEIKWNRLQFYTNE